MTSIQPELWGRSRRVSGRVLPGGIRRDRHALVGDGQDIVAQLAVGEATFSVAATESGGERLLPIWWAARPGASFWWWMTPTRCCACRRCGRDVAVSGRSRAWLAGGSNCRPVRSRMGDRQTRHTMATQTVGISIADGTIGTRSAPAIGGSGDPRSRHAHRREMRSRIGIRQIPDTMPLRRSRRGSTRSRRWRRVFGHRRCSCAGGRPVLSERNEHTWSESVCLIRVIRFCPAGRPPPVYPSWSACLARRHGRESRACAGPENAERVSRGPEPQFEVATAGTRTARSDGDAGPPHALFALQCSGGQRGRRAHARRAPPSR